MRSVQLFIGLTLCLQIQLGTERAMLNLIEGKTPLPEPKSFSMRAPPSAASDTPKQAPLLSLSKNDSGPDGPDHLSAIFSLRLRNESSQPIELPISTDGEEVYRHCPKDSILESLFSVAHGTVIRSAGGELYGCRLFKGSTVLIGPGDWITITGVPTVLHLHSESEHLVYLLEELHFDEGNSKLTLRARGILSVTSK